MSNQGKAGFGIGQFDPRAANIQRDPLELAAAGGDHTALLRLIERHLGRIEDRYVEPAMLQPQQISILGSATVFTVRIDLTTQPHNSVLICVNAGTLNLWAGDYSGIGQTANPNLGSYAAVSNTQLFLPLAGRVYTVINPSTTVALVASLVPIAL